ncbi:MAG: hypothetical protein ACTHJN_08800 [Ginsengibacter sp.]
MLLSSAVRADRMLSSVFFRMYRNDSGILSDNYNGEQCGATFSFSSNGNLETSFYDCVYGFGSTRDSAKYIVTNSQVAISILAQNLNCCSFTNFNPAIKRTYIISNLTANSATLTYSQIINSSSQKQSIATEIINLKK